MFKSGDVVMTPGGRAKIVYAKMIEYDQNMVAYYGVKLESAHYYFSDMCTIYPAREIQSIHPGHQ